MAKRLSMNLASRRTLQNKQISAGNDRAPKECNPSYFSIQQPAPLYDSSCMQQQRRAEHIQTRPGERGGAERGLRGQMISPGLSKTSGSSRMIVVLARAEHSTRARPANCPFHGHDRWFIPLAAASRKKREISGAFSHRTRYTIPRADYVYRARNHANHT